MAVGKEKTDWVLKEYEKEKLKYRQFGQSGNMLSDEPKEHGEDSAKGVENIFGLAVSNFLFGSVGFVLGWAALHFLLRYIFMITGIFWGIPFGAYNIITLIVWVVIFFKLKSVLKHKDRS